MDIFADHFPRFSEPGALLWFKHRESGGVQLTLVLDDYNDNGREQVFRSATVNFDGTRAGFRLAWSVARRLIHSQPARPALIRHDEMALINLADESPRLRWAVCANEGLTITPREARGLRSGLPKPQA